MCHKIRCDGESWKLFGFQGELNKATVLLHAMRRGHLRVQARSN